MRMPLAEFTEQTMAGLLRGDTQIAIGQAAIGWEAFEKGKQEKAVSAYTQLAPIFTGIGKQ